MSLRCRSCLYKQIALVDSAAPEIEQYLFVPDANDPLDYRIQLETVNSAAGPKQPLGRYFALPSSIQTKLKDWVQNSGISSTALVLIRDSVVVVGYNYDLLFEAGGASEQRRSEVIALCKGKTVLLESRP